MFYSAGNVGNFPEGKRQGTDDGIMLEEDHTKHITQIHTTQIHTHSFTHAHTHTHTFPTHHTQNTQNTFPTHTAHETHIRYSNPNSTRKTQHTHRTLTHTKKSFLQNMLNTKTHKNICYFKYNPPTQARSFFFHLMSSKWALK